MYDIAYAHHIIQIMVLESPTQDQHGVAKNSTEAWIKFQVCY